jgi:hypothetical protein
MAQRASILRGRDAFARQEWRLAFVQLSGADESGALEPDDLSKTSFSEHFPPIVNSDHAARRRPWFFQAMRGHWAAFRIGAPLTCDGVCYDDD